MAPKCAIVALPRPCVNLKNSMTEMGVEVSMEGLRGCEAALVNKAFNAYHRQLQNWWPETLLIRYNDLEHQGGHDDARRQCLVRYLQDPVSGGFRRDASAHLPREQGADDGQSPKKVRRVHEAAIAGADPEPPAGQHATPMKVTPVKPTPTKAPHEQAFTPQQTFSTP